MSVRSVCARRLLLYCLRFSVFLALSFCCCCYFCVRVLNSELCVRLLRLCVVVCCVFDFMVRITFCMHLALSFVVLSCGSLSPLLVVFLLLAIRRLLSLVFEHALALCHCQAFFVLWQMAVVF